ncbi:MAG: DUF2256 and DUF3253 domain-containing protein [Myxococcota bacterium]
MEKTCERCGRRIEWRKKWERNWDEIRYCSAACRRNTLTAFDTELERAILARLRRRGRNTTICPSEVVRQERPDDWREHMERVRQAARRLVARGEIVITQKGRVVDPSTAKGPIRLRLAN